MHALDGSATGIIHALEGGIPFESDGSAAGNTRLTGNAAGGCARQHAPSARR